MEIRQLTTNDVPAFCGLILNMYSHLENLEWFTPMPFDEENVKTMIEKPRFYIVGCFDDDVLCGVSSLDYKCGKLTNVINFPSECDTNKLVEIAFNMVHSDYQGNGIMKTMVSYLINKIKQNGFEWAMSKAHKNNLASLKSLQKNGFEKFCDYNKQVEIDSFKDLANQPFFSKSGKENAKRTLSKYEKDATHIVVDYDILLKKL